MAGVNEGFEVEDLQARAAAIVADDESDEQILARYVAEARAKRDEALRAKASELTAAEEGTGAAEGQGFPKKYVRLVVFKGNARSDQEFVKIGVNGYAWKIARGPEVVVPTVVANALHDAVQDVTVQSEGGLITRPALRFPYQVVGEASEKEYRDFVETSRQAARPLVAHV